MTLDWLHFWSVACDHGSSGRGVIVGRTPEGIQKALENYEKYLVITRKIGGGANVEEGTRKAINEVYRFMPSARPDNGKVTNLDLQAFVKKTLMP
jgi:hypothetical protein